MRHSRSEPISPSFGITTIGAFAEAVNQGVCALKRRARPAPQLRREPQAGLVQRADAVSPRAPGRRRRRSALPEPGRVTAAVPLSAPDVHDAARERQRAVPPLHARKRPDPARVPDVRRRLLVAAQGSAAFRELPPPSAIVPGRQPRPRRALSNLLQRRHARAKPRRSRIRAVGDT